VRQLPLCWFACKPSHLSPQKRDSYHNPRTDPLIFVVPVRPVVSPGQTGPHNQQRELLDREPHKGVLVFNSTFGVNNFTTGLWARAAVRVGDTHNEWSEPWFYI
jgi:hypothetical protein